MPSITPESIILNLSNMERPQRRRTLSPQEHGKMLDSYFGKPSTASPQGTVDTDTDVESPMTIPERMARVGMRPFLQLYRQRGREAETPEGRMGIASRMSSGGIMGGLAGLSMPSTGLFGRIGRGAGYGLGAGIGDVIAPGAGSAFVAGRAVSSRLQKPIEALAQKMVEGKTKMVPGGRIPVKTISTVAKQYRIPKAEAKLALQAAWRVAKKVPPGKTAQFLGKALPVASKALPYAAALPPIVSALYDAMRSTGTPTEKIKTGAEGALTSAGESILGQNLFERLRSPWSEMDARLGQTTPLPERQPWETLDEPPPGWAEMWQEYERRRGQ